MRDKLKDLLKDTLQERECNVSDNTIEQISEHLVENGITILPCKVGDKIYALSASKTKLYLLTITHFVVCENETQIWAVGAPYASESTYICNADDLGNNEWVYLAREEAEKALAERSENGT